MQSTKSVNLVAKGFGKRMKTAREAAGYTRLGLAKALGVAITTLRYIEGGHNISIQMAVRVSALLEVSLDYLVFGKGELTIGQLELEIED